MSGSENRRVVSRSPFTKTTLRCRVIQIPCTPFSCSQLEAHLEARAAGENRPVHPQLQREEASAV
jgi:hypothetical protein